MEVEPFENPWIKKIRGLTHLLLLSTAFNIALATALITHKVREKKSLIQTICPPKSTKVVLSNAQVIKKFFECSFEELIEELQNTELVQDGFSRRDLALACMTAFHHFDLKRAVIGKDIQVRNLSFVHADGGEQFDLEVYSSLDQTDFQLIQNFIKREKWPLTTEGLFEELKKESSQPKLTSSLAQAFVSTSEFYTLYTLFRRKSDHVKASEVLQMLLEGPWKFFEEFIALQKSSPDLTEASMRDLLTKYVRFGASTASLLWIKLDSEFVLRGLDDQLLKEVLEPIQEATTQSVVFLKQLLCSVRSDGLREMAGRKLYAWEKAQAPEPYSHEVALHRFLPALAPKELPSVKPEPMAAQVVFHTVKEGESLWKIAKKYQISISDIRSVNQLKNDRLKPGQKIEIPRRKGKS